MNDYRHWLTLAQGVAFGAHAGQLDKAGHPYIEHPRAVATSLTDHGPDAVVAGWLHDVVEDTPVTLDDLRNLGFSEAVVEAVDSVTRREGETYFEMIRRAAAHPLGRVVKLADNAHNFGRLGNLHEREAAFLGQRYRRAREILLAAGNE